MALSVDDITKKIADSIEGYERLQALSTTTEHAKDHLSCKIIALQKIQIYIYDQVIKDRLDVITEESKN